MSFLRQLNRSFRYGLLAVFRDPLGSVSSIFVYTLTLLVIGSTLLGNFFIQDTLDNLSEKLDVTIYFSIESTETQVLGFKEKLLAREDVIEVVYTSKEDALEEFKVKHEDEQWIFEILDLLGENPLRARIAFRASDPIYLEDIVSYVQNEDLYSDSPVRLIDDVTYFQSRLVIERIDSIIQFVSLFPQLVIAILIVFSLLIGAALLHLLIYVSRDEIAVMRLIGASKMYIRLPFIISSTFYGLIASIVSLVILYPTALTLNTVTEEFFGGNGLLYYYADNIFLLSSIIILCGVSISMVGGIFAVWRYIR